MTAIFGPIASPGRTPGFPYHSAGRTGEAIDLQEQVLIDTTRLLGADHPDTLTAG